MEITKCFKFFKYNVGLFCCKPMQWLYDSNALYLDSLENKPILRYIFQTHGDPQIKICPFCETPVKLYFSDNIEKIDFCE